MEKEVKYKVWHDALKKDGYPRMFANAFDTPEEAEKFAKIMKRQYPKRTYEISKETIEYIKKI